MTAEQGVVGRMKVADRERSMAGTPIAGTLALLLACSVTTARLQADERQDDAIGKTGPEPSRQMSDESSPPVAMRPRWIEPRRSDEPAMTNDTAVRDWRRDARIVVHARRNRTPVASRVEDLLERQAAGDVERRTVAATASSHQVRFFHAEDAAMAAELAAHLEPLFGALRVRDLTFYRPLPASGALEVWLR